MENELLLDLINSGVVRTGTEVTILRKGMDLGGSLNARIIEKLEVISHKKVKGNIVLEAFNISDGRKFNVRAKHISLIDGMPPNRLVEAHKSEGKKRGRKPKKR